MYKLVLLPALTLSAALQAHAGAWPPEGLQPTTAAPLVAATSVEQSIEDKHVIQPDQMRTIPVSNTDNNYVRCKNGAITDRTFSKEKPIVFKKTDSAGHGDAFIKLKIRETPDGKLQYYSKVTEFYITCDGQVFGFLMHPQQIPTQRIVLDGGQAKDLQANIRMFKEMPLEQLVVDLIDKVQYGRDLPGSYTETVVSSHSEWVTITPATRARKIRTIKPDGIGLAVHQYLVTARALSQLNEFDFVTPELERNIQAVRLTEHRLPPRGTAHAYIVERVW